MNLRWMRVWGMHVLLVLALLAMTQPVAASKYPYEEFKNTIAYEVIEVLEKYGLPVSHDRELPWFYISGIPGSYTLKFHQADEIPQQAVLDVVRLCMDFYEQRGRKERYRIVMYRESQKAWRNSLFLGVATLTTMKPFFELTIGEKE